MKTKIIAVIFITVTALVVLAASMIHRKNELQTDRVTAPVAERGFDVKGRVVSLEADGTTIHIAHEEIPDFMAAMTMPFTVQKSELLRGLAPGDSVKFHLVVTKEDSWISRIEKIGSATKPSAVVSPPASSKLRIEVGQSIPNFHLIDQDGRPVELAKLRGKVVVLTFIYTRCPIPNYCPLMSKNFAELQERFGKKFPGQVQLLSVSFDPQFDTSEVLKRYAENFGANNASWNFATGTKEQVEYVAALFGLIKEPEGSGFSHDLRTALISPDGKLVHLFRSNVWTANEAETMVGETLEQHSSPQSLQALR